ncbi:MAG: CDP-alcohol phosphatidyltransferase family protein [Gemmatimonadetes bacterium]|nr:CDP-alcohol phosphatidyltransferase family protein [Gemmatimonadota bacterium]
MTSTPDSSGSRRRAARDLFVGAPAALAVGGATWWLLDLPATFVVEVVALYGGLAVIFLATMPASVPGPGIGPANRITFGRALLLLPLAALALHPLALDTSARWLVVVVGTVIMVMDGFDGWMARRTGTESDFGARFDMETDAFLMLVLSVLVWVEGRAGAWVLLIGGMRYLFVAAGWVVPRLQGDLFPSLRRKVVCVVQGVVLLVALGPIIPDVMAVGVAAVGLAALVYSFGVDTVWLLRREAA